MNHAPFVFVMQLTMCVQVLFTGVLQCADVGTARIAKELNLNPRFCNRADTATKAWYLNRAPATFVGLFSYVLVHF